MSDSPGNDHLPSGGAGPAVAASRLRRWLPLAFVAVVMAVAFQQGWHSYLSLETLAAHEETLHRLVEDNFIVALAGFAVVYVASVALSVPGALVLTLTGGFLFGWLVGGTVAVFAATTGASLVFLVARTAIGDRLAVRAGPRLAALREGFRRDALNYLLFLRLVPAFPFWLVNLAPALAGVRLSTFVAATFMGIIPGTFALAVVGAGLDSLFAGQRVAYQACVARGDSPDGCRMSIDPSALLTPGLLAAFVALGVLAVLPVAFRRLMARRLRHNG